MDWFKSCKKVFVKMVLFKFLPLNKCFPLFCRPSTEALNCFICHYFPCVCGPLKRTGFGLTSLMWHQQPRDNQPTKSEMKLYIFYLLHFINQGTRETHSVNWRQRWLRTMCGLCPHSPFSNVQYLLQHVNTAGHISVYRKIRQHRDTQRGEFSVI